VLRRDAVLGEGAVDYTAAAVKLATALKKYQKERGGWPKPEWRSVRRCRLTLSILC